jgi:hypothetical protein
MTILRAEGGLSASVGLPATVGQQAPTTTDATSTKPPHKGKVSPTSVSGRCKDH